MTATDHRPLWVPLGHKCAVRGCDTLAVKALRYNSSTVIPICAQHEAKRQSDVLMDGDAMLTIRRERLAFLPE
jgi:hypothetical protein